MSITTKLQPVFIILAAIMGLILGGLTSFGEYSVSLIEPFLMALLFMVFLSVDLKSMGSAFRDYKFTLVSLLVNFIWTPVFAIILGKLFLNNSIDLQVGFLMLLVTPCTDWYLVFTGLSKGNVTLAASILPLNIILQVVLLPVYLFVFMGNKVGMNGMDVVSSIIIVLVIPMVLAQLLKMFFVRTEKGKLRLNWLKEYSDNIQLVFLCVAVVAMFASEGRALLNNPSILLQMLIPLVCFFIFNFLFVYFISARLRMPFTDRIPLIMTTLARNSPLSLAIAVAAFPDRPFISLALVIGPLIELPVLGIVSNILIRLGRK